MVTLDSDWFLSERHHAPLRSSALSCAAGLKQRAHWGLLTQLAFPLGATRQASHANPARLLTEKAPACLLLPPAPASLWVS